MGLHTTGIWETRTTGNDANGGYFNPSASGVGTDYSQQNTAQLSLSDVVTIGTTTVTSAAGGFTAAMIGNAINIAGVIFEITTRSSTTSITVDRNTGTGSGQTGKVGGALLTVEGTMHLAIAVACVSNKFYFKSGPFNVSTFTAWSNNANGPLLSYPQGAVWEGYTATRGDGTLGCVTIKANTTSSPFTVFVNGATSDLTALFITLDCNNQSQTAYGFYQALLSYQCVVKNYQTAAFQAFGIAILCVADNASLSGSGAGFAIGNAAYCFTKSSDHGFQSNASRCVSDRCVVGFAPSVGNTVTECTAYKCGYGFYATSLMVVDQCLSVLATSFGFNLDSVMVKGCYSASDAVASAGTFAPYSDAIINLGAVQPLYDPENKNYGLNPALAGAAISVPRSFAASSTTYTSAGAVQLAADIAQGVWGSTTRTITGGTVANLTNAPTNGDLTSAMKASVAQASGVVHAGQATGAGGTVLVLDAGASTVDGAYVGCYLVLQSGSGTGLFRLITGYVGSTKTATVDAWGLVPSGPPLFAILSAAGIGAILAGVQALPSAVQVASIIEGYPHVWYVSSANGNDSTGTGSISSPFQTLSGTVSHAALGDAIIMDASAPYAETSAVTVPCDLYGLPGATLTSSSTDVQVIVCNASIFGMTLITTDPTAITLTMANPAKVERVTVQSARWGLYSTVYIQVADSDFSATGNSGPTAGSISGGGTFKRCRFIASNSTSLCTGFSGLGGTVLEDCAISAFGGVGNNGVYVSDCQIIGGSIYVDPTQDETYSIWAAGGVATTSGTGYNRALVEGTVIELTPASMEAVTLPSPAPATYGGGTGIGAYAITIHVTDGASAAIANASVRLTGTSGATGTTNSSGNVVLSVDAATYVLTATKGGYNYAGTTQVITGTATINVVMTAVTITPPATAGQTVGVCNVYDAFGLPTNTATIEVEVVSGPGTAGASYARSIATATITSHVANAQLPKGCTAKARRDSGQWTDTFNTGNADSFNLPEILGRPTA